jgi:hypothetical protein
MNNGATPVGIGHLPPGRIESVAWIDLMGTGSMMRRAPAQASANIGSLFNSIVQISIPDSVEVFPVMDGLYITEPRGENNIIDIVEDIFFKMSSIFLSRNKQLEYRPIIRGAIAEGLVHHGSDMMETKLSHSIYSKQLIFGKPVAEAHNCERKAPPYGIRIHKSFSNKDKNLNHVWCTYDHGKDIKLKFINYCNIKNIRDSYPEERRKEHLQLVREYFNEKNMSYSVGSRDSSNH